MTREFNALDFILDILFPNRCPCCGDFAAFNAYTCEKCAGNLEAARWCETTYDTPENCDDVFAAYRYEGAAVEALYALKFTGDRNFARLSAALLSDVIKGGEFDGIIAVPMGRERRGKRGYNQADVFAKYLSKYTGLQVYKHILFRKNDKEQHKLSAVNRFENARLAYGIFDNTDLRGKKIILADDVETTGATLAACGRLLKEAGASTITVAVAIKTLKMF
jgi:ComF family protein